MLKVPWQRCTLPAKLLDERLLNRNVLVLWCRLRYPTLFKGVCKGFPQAFRFSSALTYGDKHRPGLLLSIWQCICTRFLARCASRPACWTSSSGTHTCNWAASLSLAVLYIFSSTLKAFPILS